MYTCDTCYWWDYGLCDRRGRETDEDEWCEKWSKNGDNSSRDEARCLVKHDEMTKQKGYEEE